MATKLSLSSSSSNALRSVFRQRYLVQQQQRQQHQQFQFQARQFTASSSVRASEATSDESTNGPRPFKVHIGVSFAGKPNEFRAPLKKRRKNGLDFPPESEIAKWRAKSLARVKGVPAKDAGEDFFFVQEVRVIYCCCSLLFSVGGGKCYNNTDLTWEIYLFRRRCGIIL